VAETISVWVVDQTDDRTVYEAVGGALYLSQGLSKSPSAVAWGPAGDGSREWFLRYGDTNAIRVVDRRAAIDHMLGRETKEPTHE